MTVELPVPASDGVVVGINPVDTVCEAETDIVWDWLSESDGC